MGTWSSWLPKRLMHVVALGALRLAQRRILAEGTAIDFVAAVATGAIMGRTALDRRDQLRLCGLTDNGVRSPLCQPGDYNLSGLRNVLYETEGRLTVVPASEAADQELIQIGLSDATGYDGS